jgi:hypothetical protein
VQPPAQTQKANVVQAEAPVSKIKVHAYFTPQEEDIMDDETSQYTIRKDPAN